MVSRRRFIGSGVAGSLAAVLAAEGLPGVTAATSASAAPGATAVRGASAAPGATAGAGATAAPSPIDTSRRLPLHAVVFDERFEQAVRFGGEASRLGLRSRSIRGDVTDLWFNELHPLWKRAACPVAGVTAYAALFCLERLGWNHGLRVVYHDVQSALVSGVDWPAHADRPTRADWPLQAASLIAGEESRSGWSGRRPVRREARARLLASTPVALPAALHCWVIASPARAGERA